MKKYTEYKKSGVKWLGDIPDNWEVSRIGWLFPNTGSGTTPDSNKSSYYSEDGFNWFQTGDLTDGDIVETSKKVTEAAIKDKKMKIYPSGSIVVAMYGATIGKVGRLKIDTTTNQACCVLPPVESLDNNYVFYLMLSSKEALLSKSIGGGQPNISQAIIKEHEVPFPSLLEQQKIAEYLDYKTARIEAAKSALVEQYEDLKEYRKGIISEAVTKGLDPNAKMQDSGVEWIGEIPEGWNCVPLKKLFQIVSGATPDSSKAENWEGEIPWVTPADFKTVDHFVENGRKSITQEGYDSCSTKLVPIGSIIFSKRAPIGSVVIANKELCTNQGCLSCIPNDSVFSHFFYYVMSTMTDIFNMLGTGTTFKEISAQNFADTKVQCPPFAEQQAIADHLDKKTAKIDAAMKEIDLQIKDLDKLKQAIISEAVTGKIDVRDWKRPNE